MFVKICGTTNEDDALLAVAMGADAIGFILAPSRRQIPPVRAGDIAKRLPTSILTVGVFRNEAPKRVVEVVNRYGLGMAQLHGSESPEDVAWIAERVPRTMKVFTAGTPEVRRAGDWGTNPILVDAPHGGQGVVFDWALAREVPVGMRVILAGGLRPENVAEAIQTVRPWGVDVATGVERDPGHKDPTKLREFVTAAKEAFAAYPAPPDVAHPDIPVPYDWHEGV